jgi:hypothetical protein
VESEQSFKGLEKWIEEEEKEVLRIGRFRGN